MPPRDPRQPDRVMERYRERLNDEMTEHAYTDRTLAEKLTQAGFPIGHTAIFKTRKGTRQPSLDECMWIAHVLGYPDLDTFIEGPITIKIQRAIAKIQFAASTLAMEQRTTFHQGLQDLRYALQDPDAVAVLDQKVPDWRESYLAGIRDDRRWIMRDLMALWAETDNRITEIFNGVPQPDPAEIRALMLDLIRKGIAEGDPSIVGLAEEAREERAVGSDAQA